MTKQKNKIVLYKGVEYWGKISSKFALFEIIFSKFCFIVKEDASNIIIEISDKSNNFLKTVRSGEPKIIYDEKTIPLMSNKLILVKNNLRRDNKSYYYRDKYLYTDDNYIEYIIKDLYLIDKICFFFYENNLAILPIAIIRKANEHLLMFGTLDYIIKSSSFNFFSKNSKNLAEIEKVKYSTGDQPLIINMVGASKIEGIIEDSSNKMSTDSDVDLVEGGVKRVTEDTVEEVIEDNFIKEGHQINVELTSKNDFENLKEGELNEKEELDSVENLSEDLK